MKNLEQIKADRFRVLNHLYELTKGNEAQVEDMWEIGEKLGLQRDETKRIAQYLKGEGLIETVTMGGGISITHYGIVQVEDALSHPETATEYFPPIINIIQIQNMNNSQIQQGTQDSTLITSMQLSESENASIIALLKEIKEALSDLVLSDRQQKDISGEIATVEAQLTTSLPKKSIINESLSSIKIILEQTGAAILAAKVVQLLGGFK